MTAPNATHQVANTLGALQIGLSLSVTLLGACSLQCHYYFQHYKEDRWMIKAVVAVIWFLEFAHAGVMLHAVYDLNVKKFGNYPAIQLKTAPWSVNLLVPFSAALDIIVELCFIYRVKVLSRQWITPIICWILIALRAVFVVVATVICFKKTFGDIASDYKYTLDVAVIALALVDMIIAMSMLYYLHRIRSGFPSSDQVLNRLGVFAFECGFITFGLGISILITATTMPSNYIWLALLCIHSKVYSNALLLSLNRRQAMAQAFGSPVLELTLNRPSKLSQLGIPEPSFSSRSSPPTLKQEPIIDIYSRKGEDVDVGVCTDTDSSKDT